MSFNMNLFSCAQDYRRFAFGSLTLGHHCCYSSYLCETSQESCRFSAQILGQLALTFLRYIGGLQMTDLRESISEWFFQAQRINFFSSRILRISREPIHILELLPDTIIVHLASNYSNRKIGNHCISGLKKLMA